MDYSDILEFSPDPTWVIDRDGRVIVWNRACEELTGVPAAEMLGKGNFEHALPFYGERRPILIDAALRHDPEIDARYPTLIRKDETLAAEVFLPRLGPEGIYLWMTARPLFDADGNVSGAIESARDITARKQAEGARQVSERRLTQLLESVHLVAVTLDSAGRVTFCNGFLLALTGWSREEVVGSDWFERFIPEDEREYIRAVFLEGILSDTLLPSFENRIIARDGNLRMIVWQNTVLHNPDGTVSGVASLGTDVTGHRSLEEQLRQSQKMEAVGQLAGGVAHDFNNILTVIMGYGNLMRMKMPDGSPERANLDQVLDAAGRAAELTKGLLAFSRKQVIAPRTVELNGLILDVEKFLRRIIGEDIRLQASLTGSEPTVHVDKGQIEQVLINLATNARDAMPKGGLLAIATDLRELDESFIKAHGYGETGRYAVISVSDTGNGMDEGTRNRVFEPFYTTKEPGQGTGLGLSIVYGIVKQHNGYINVYSEPGRGTIFRIYLPLVAQEQPDAGEKGAPPVPKGGTETILLAEDEPSVRKLVEIVLTNFGYTVILAEDGQDAVEKFRANRDRVSLLLMDLIMPGKNGREAYEEIRRMAPGIKVLFSSGYTADIIRSRGELDEDAELIYKPVDPMTLAAKVREILDRE